MSRTRIEIPIGSKIGRWTVLEKVEEFSSTRYICKCSCEKGTIRSVLGKSLKNGKSKSCGCIAGSKTIGKRVGNDYTVKDDYIIFYDSKGNEFIVDKEDFEKVKNHPYTWYVRNHEKEKYVISKVKGKELKLHNFIMNPKEGFIVDHINGKPYDNRRSNLRITTVNLNAKNKGLNRINTSGVSGVHQTSKGKWVARIGVDGKRIHLGTFDLKEDAIKKRLDAEKYYYGEYSRVNI